MSCGGLRTLTQSFARLRRTNTTSTSFPTRIPTLTEPTGIGDAAAQTTSAVFDLVKDFDVEFEVSKNRVLIVPFGAGTDTQTFSMRVIGWRIAYDRDTARLPQTAIWIPIPLADFSCALSVQVGVAGSVVVATDTFCDTITLTGTTANDDVDVSITSPGNDLTGHIVLDMKGFQKLEITFDMTGATSGNALVSWY